MLQQNDPSKPYILKTDEGSYSLGAVFFQEDSPQKHPIEYAGRLLSKAERNYTTTEREALAVVWSLNKFRDYMEGLPITVMTDDQPLRWLLSLRSPTGRLARWALTIQSFDIKLENLPGKRNVVADMLSRSPCDHNTEITCDICSTIIKLPSCSAQDIRFEQKKDPDVLKIIDSFEDINSSEFFKWSERGYIMSNGELYKYTDEDDT